MDQDFYDLFSSDDEDELVLYNINRRRPYTVQQRFNHFDRWDDVDFFRRFRLTKASVTQLLNLIVHRLAYKFQRNHAVTPINQLLMALRFYAVGNVYTAVGDFGGVHKSTAGRIVKKVSEAIAGLHREFISFPQTPDGGNRLQQEFYVIARFPRVAGALDCTHVRLQSPGGDHAENFRNRKGYFSMNVQVVCNANMKILDIVARWPGAAHDSTIFDNSRLKARFETRQMGNSVLVGDSGYALKQYLITPLNNPITDAERLFNEAQIRTRNVIERCFGVWKKRFPILSVGMKVKIPLAQDIIVAAAVLHNLAYANNEVAPPDDPEVAVADELLFDEVVNEENNNLADNVVRNALINDYFANLL